MKTQTRSILTVYIFLLICGSSAFAQGERTIVLGGASSWRVAEIKTGVTEVSSVRPHPVLVLSSATGMSTEGYTAASGVWGNFTALTESAHDLSLSFDENSARNYRDSTGRYRITAAPGVETVDRRYARAGAGAALFGNTGSIKIEPLSADSLFASGARIRDFTIEFWLQPLNMENGEQILSWISVAGANVSQRINCVASRNRLNWSFVNFFTSTNGASYINLEFSGIAPVVPKIWSHHLIRFDASTGLLEYIVNGSVEAAVYATATDRENGEVFTPVAGRNGSFLLGERFMGMIDEFKIHDVCIGRSTIQKYAAPGGRMETGAVDLGENNSGVLKVNVSGGRIGINGRTVGNIASNTASNEFRENGRFRFACAAEMNFFIRAGENPFLLNRSPWLPFTPGADITDARGRYVQIAVDFYPSSDGETSPYLSELCIVYMPGEPPLPPRNVTAVAVDGGVMLRWRSSPSDNTAGYRVYYSAVRGELFGSDALLGPSPIDVGNRNDILIEGLKNGTLYYFRIVAYDQYNTGEFSAEVTGRPLAGLSLQEITLVN